LGNGIGPETAQAGHFFYRSGSSTVSYIESATAIEISEETTTKKAGARGLPEN
jgi:hypothetical protein